MGSAALSGLFLLALIQAAPGQSAIEVQAPPRGRGQGREHVDQPGHDQSGTAVRVSEKDRIARLPLDDRCYVGRAAIFAAVGLLAGSGPAPDSGRSESRPRHRWSHGGADAALLAPRSTGRRSARATNLVSAARPPLSRSTTAAHRSGSRAILRCLARRSAVSFGAVTGQ